MNTSTVISLVEYAAGALRDRKEEVNRLNVFPVPDGDTGTNMSLTTDAVLGSLKNLPATCTYHDMRKAISHGALMGARGNSGVILSQILRGLMDGMSGCEMPPTSDEFAKAMEKAVEVAFQSVRKPVEGTILTVLRDSADAAVKSAHDGLVFSETVQNIASAALYSVKRTPELLPVLKENNVVDAGGFGLAILFEACAAFISGDLSLANTRSISAVEAYQPKVAIEQINDWEGSAYRYCNEFLFHTQEFDREAGIDFLSTMGDCELLVGEVPDFKVHVHSNTPDQVLAYFLARGQISEVHIHNMQLQSEERVEKIEEESAQPKSRVNQFVNFVSNSASRLAKKEKTPQKEIGVVAVAPSEEIAQILKSLGVDEVISGGQTMNPSTADILAAMEAANAKNILVFPNNKNIIMAAQAAVSAFEGKAHVVATKSVLHAFDALITFDPSLDFEMLAQVMNGSFSEVRVAEVTTAVKDAKAENGDPIAAGDVIGIADDAIVQVGSSVEAVTLELLALFAKDDEFDLITLLAGSGLSETQLESLSSKIEEHYPDAELDVQRGNQPLYPVLFSVE